MNKKITPELPIFRASLLLILLLLLTTCGGYDPDSTGGTGDIAFKIDWQGTPTSSKSKIRNPQSEILSYAPIDCTAIGVSIVSATVYSSTGSSLTTGGPWSCSDHSGNITSVPAGSDRKLAIFGKDSSGNILYYGEQTGITVVDGQTSSTVTVTVTPTGSAPSAPTGVTATAGNGQVSISWSPVSGATSYNIYWSTATGVTKTTGTKLTGATSPYTHTGLTNGMTYYHVVTAVNSYGESSESNQVSATPSSTATSDTTAPSSPSVSINSGASSTTSTSVTLALSATDTVGVTGYCAKESSTTPSSNDSCWTSVTSTTSYSATVAFTLDSVGDNTKTVYVWFKDAAGNISASANDSITLGSAPSAPTGVSATAGSGQVSVSWSSVSGATSYNIYWSTTSGVTKTTGTKITGGTSSYTHTGLTNGTTYYYVVTAVNSYGESSESSQVSGTPTSSTTLTLATLSADVTLSRIALDSNNVYFDENYFWEKYKGVGGNFSLKKDKFLLVLQHPVTTEFHENREHINETLMALNELKIPTIMLWPNADAGSDEISKGIRSFRENNRPDWLHVFKNLPMEIFVQLMDKCKVLIGNTSSAIREGGIVGVPVVNIGTRQQGRCRGANVIDVDYKHKEIYNAIKKQIEHGKYKPNHIYGDGKAGKKIAKILSEIDLNKVDIQKRILI